MGMTKDVLVAISGLQFAADEETGNIETIHAGEYYCRNGHHYVIYDETEEESGQNTRNILKFGEQGLELTKRGFVNVHMLFEENQRSLTNYATPFGDILIGIDTRRVTFREREDRLSMEVEYTLEANYEFLADCRISMEVSSRDTEAEKQGMSVLS